MIPREIIKKIRQIEIRTNRLVTESLAGYSFHSSVQLRRISRPVPNCNHFNFRMRFVDGKINCVWPAKNLRSTTFTASFGKSKWFSRNCGHHFIYFECKSNAEPCVLTFIPGNGFPKFKDSFGVMDDPEAHFLYLASVSSRSCSQGIPRPGVFRASSARRSSSAICSRVRWSTNSFSIRSTSSRRSASGIRRSSSRISVALMGLNLPAIEHFASA